MCYVPQGIAENMKSSVYKSLLMPWFYSLSHLTGIQSSVNVTVNGRHVSLRVTVFGGLALDRVNVSVIVVDLPLTPVGLLACEGHSTRDCHVQKALLQVL